MDEKDLDLDPRRLVVLERNAREKDAVRKGEVDRAHDLRDRRDDKRLELSKLQSNPITKPERIAQVLAEIEEINGLIRSADDETAAVGATASNAQMTFKRAREFAVQMGLSLPPEIKKDGEFFV